MKTSRDGVMTRQEAMTQGDDSQPVGEAQGATHEKRSNVTQPQARNHLRTASLQETQHLGALLGHVLKAGDVVLLTGTLGVGKTAFTQGIGAGLGVRETINSPTFTLVKEYAGRLPLYHFDLYRIEEPEELYALGFEEYFGGDGVAVVEWAERGADAQGAVWPSSWLRVALRVDASHPNKRTLDLTARGIRGQALLADFLAAVRETGWMSATDASSRKESDHPSGAERATAEDTAGEGV